MLRIKQKMVSASLCCLLPSAVLAQLPEGGVRQDAPSQDAAVQVQQKQWLDILSEEERSSEKNENVGEPTVVSDDFLAANPRILEDALIQALNGNSADLVSSLAALYRKQPNHNPKLIARADALLAKLKGRNSEAEQGGCESLHSEDCGGNQCASRVRPQESCDSGAEPKSAFADPLCLRSRL